MPYRKITDMYKFLDACGREHKRELALFRGQDVDKPLLPKIARDAPSKDTTAQERQMLLDLRRVGCAYLPDLREDDWDMLARAQHFGMATRLLDWTSNPLSALWFAAKDLDRKASGFVYFYTPAKEHVLSDERGASPFTAGRTSVFRPTWNNPRITAQSGWFTVHRYSKASGRFVALESNPNIKTHIDCWEVPGDEKPYIIEDLDQLGVNYQSMFPDLEGVCRHLNWIYDDSPPPKA